MDCEFCFDQDLNMESAKGKYGWMDGKMDELIKRWTDV